MVSLFEPDEEIYDKYSACIAATEPLRNRRDSDAISSLNPLDKFLYNFSPFKSHRQICTASRCERNVGVKMACSRHLFTASKVIRSLGLTVKEFNAVGREVGLDEKLRRRVMEQAYLYRVASTLRMEKVPVLEDPDAERRMKAHSKRRIQNFAKSLSQIEDLRGEQRELLRRSLNVPALPKTIGICDPFLLPMLNSKIQQTCKQFPNRAEEIVQEYGLTVDDFNRLLLETRRNPLLRWRVTRYIKRTNGRNAVNREGIR